MPTGFDIQKRFDALKADLSNAAQMSGSGKATSIAVRESDNSLTVLELTSTAAGVLDAAETAAVQAVVDSLKTAQDAYNTAKSAYDFQNVSENLANLSNAMGEYVATFQAG